MQDRQRKESVSKDFGDQQNKKHEKKQLPRDEKIADKSMGR